MNSSPPEPPAPAANFRDPRLEPDFEDSLWPMCDGKSGPPPGTAELHERRCIEFLSAFYRVNLGMNALLLARASNCSDETAKELEVALARAQTELESLENRYAPVGFFGDPVMDGLLYREIHFVRPEPPRHFPQPVEQSVHFAIPGLEDIPASELQGTPRRFRLHRNGKVDL